MQRNVFLLLVFYIIFFSLRCCSSVGLLPPMRLWQCLHLACIASMYFITLLQRRRHRPTLFPAAAIVIVIEDPQHTQPRHRNAVKSQRERFFCSDSSLKIPVAEWVNKLTGPSDIFTLVSFVYKIHVFKDTLGEGKGCVIDWKEGREGDGGGCGVDIGGREGGVIGPLGVLIGGILESILDESNAPMQNNPVITMARWNEGYTDIFTYLGLNPYKNGR